MQIRSRLNASNRDTLNVMGNKLKKGVDQINSVQTLPKLLVSQNEPSISPLGRASHRQPFTQIVSALTPDNVRQKNQNSRPFKSPRMSLVRLDKKEMAGQFSSASINI